MSYRQSSYDPLAPTSTRGAPLRPFNGVQWLGVAIAGAGLVATVLMMGAAFGVAQLGPFRHFPFYLPLLIGQMLIYSRRQQVTPLDSAEQRARNRRATAITAVVLVFVFAALLIAQGA